MQFFFSKNLANEVLYVFTVSDIFPILINCNRKVKKSTHSHYTQATISDHSIQRLHKSTKTKAKAKCKGSRKSLCILRLTGKERKLDCFLKSTANTKTLHLIHNSSRSGIDPFYLF